MINMVVTRSSWDRFFNHRHIKRTMQRLSPEDLQAIVTGVATDPELIKGIAAQLTQMGALGKQQSHQSTRTPLPLTTTQGDQKGIPTTGHRSHQLRIQLQPHGQTRLPNSRLTPYKNYPYLCKVCGLATYCI